MANGYTYLAGPDKGTTWFFKDVNASPTFTWGDFPDHDPRPRLGHHRPAAVRAGRADQAARHRRRPVQRGAVDDHHRAVRHQRPSGWQLQTGKDNVYGRGHANTVLLPDGSMVEVGGGRGSLD